MNIPLSLPSINQSDIGNVLKVLDSRQLVQGDKVKSLEKAVVALNDGPFRGCFDPTDKMLVLCLPGVK